MKKKFRLIASTVLAALTLAGCSSGTNHNAAASSPVSATTSAAAASPSAGPLGCVDRAVAWRDSGGSADLNALASGLHRDSAAFIAGSRDMRAMNVTAVEAKLGPPAAGLLSAAQTAQADPSPPCSSEIRSHYEKALSALVRSALSQQDALSAMNNGNYQTAAADLNASSAAFVAGTQQLVIVTRDFKNLGNGG